MKHINFKHCGKVYSVKQHDKIVCFKTSEILSITNVSYDYIFTLSSGAILTPNQLYNLVNG
jgi:hypothetical protein